MEFPKKVSAFFEVYDDSISAVLGDGATLAQALEVLAILPAIQPTFQEARMRALKIVEHRGAGGQLYSMLTAAQAEKIRADLGDDAAPRVIFHKETGTLYDAAQPIPKVVLDFEEARRPKEPGAG